MARKVLIIDDDIDILSIVQLYLSEEGFDVDIRQSGVYAEEILALKPDLILLDVRIAGYPRTGVEICLELKSNPILANVPVILFSSESDLSSLAASCSANGYVAKPFDLEKLTEKVRSFLEN